MKIPFMRKPEGWFCTHCLNPAKRDEKRRFIPCDHGKPEKK